MKNGTNIIEYIGGVFLVMITFISILNLTAGIIGGVWLLFAGLFSEVGIGFLYSIFGHYILGLAMMIPLVFGAPGAIMFEKKKYLLGSVFLMLNQIFTIVIIYFSVMYVFGVAVQLSEYANFIPVLLFAYAVSFSPWAFLANEDKKAGNQNATITVISGQLGFVLGVILMLITGQGMWVSVLFIAGLLSATVINIIPIIGEMKTK